VAGRWHPAGHAGGERGMVTLELALASLGAAAVMVVLAWVLTVIVLLVRCQDTATGVARQEARGDAAASAAVASRRPEGARVGIGRGHGEIHVVVDLEARPWATWLPAIPLSASAMAIPEPS
jgi:hypothetical protein